MGQPQNKNLRPFPRVLGISDFGITGNKTLVGATFTRTGAFTVGAQQEATYGISVLRAGGAEGEPIYMNLVDDSIANIDGTVRLRLTNAQETRSVDVIEQRTERLRASQNDRTQAYLLPEFGQNAKEDSKLVIDVKVDSSSNVTFDYDATNSKFLIPVTIYQ